MPLGRERKKKKKKGWRNEIGTHDAHDTHANEVIACCVVKRCQVAPVLCVRAPPWLHGHTLVSVDYLDSRKQSVKERNIVTLYIYVFVLFAARRPFIERALIQATVVSSVTTRVSVGCNRWRSFRTDGQRPPPHSFHTHKNSTQKKKTRIDNNRNGRED